MNQFKLYTYTILILFLSIVVACKVKKVTPPIQPMPFAYPDDIKAEEKEAFVKNYTKGQILYQITCAKCHNKTEGDQSIIPNFSLPQLMDYEIRIQYPSHEDPMRVTNLSEEELQQVISFLRYKKPS
ncbi:MAG: hypothetical protein PSX81_07430 [bacterium]|nr:hypothetical protein [bacterium]